MMKGDDRTVDYSSYEGPGLALLGIHGVGETCGGLTCFLTFRV